MAFSPRSDVVAIGVLGAVLIVVVAAAAWQEATPEWRRHQADVRRIVEQRMGAEAAGRVKTGLRQTWIPELGRADRCVTCHATIDWGPELADAPNPARSHPRVDLFDHHPIERFGCTLCHGGQGYAVEAAAAHGDVAFWDEPLLDRARARRHGATRAQLLESSCNGCHRLDEQVEGMPLLNEAKALVSSRRCVRCHTIHGKGGTTGPDLTRVGDKHPSHFAFPEPWTKPRTALAWHVAHFADPAAVVPGSEMPKFQLDDRQRLALALLVMSWRKSSLPSAWIPPPKVAPRPPR